jgi:hypothetical protein
MGHIYIRKINYYIIGDSKQFKKINYKKYSMIDSFPNRNILKFIDVLL